MTSGLDDLLTKRRVSRRAFVGGSAAAATALTMSGLLKAPGVFAANGKEFHSAWPYDPPPKGHFNLMQGVTNAIMAPPNIYADMIIQPFAMYYWASGEWLPLMATKWGFVNGDTFTVTLRQGAKWSDGKDFTSKDVLTRSW